MRALALRVLPLRVLTLRVRAADRRDSRDPARDAQQPASCKAAFSPDAEAARISRSRPDPLRGGDVREHRLRLAAGDRRA